MLHHRDSTVTQKGQTRRWFTRQPFAFSHFLKQCVCEVGEGEMRGVQVVTVCIHSTGCHKGCIDSGVEH